MPKPVRPSRGVNVIAVALLARFLLDGTRSMKELADETGLNINTVERYCAAFRNAGAAYVCNWRIDPRGVYSIRIYKLGEGVDVPPPVRTPRQNAQRMREARLAAKEGKPYKYRTHTNRHAYGP